MQKDFYITAQKPGYTQPQIYATYDAALAAYNPATQVLLRATFDTPKPLQTARAQEVRTPRPPVDKAIESERP